MAKLESLIAESSRPLVLWVLGAASFVFMLVFTAVITPAIEAVAGGPPPDVVLYQTPQQFAAWLERGGAEVRRLYGWFLLADTFYPLIYGLFFAALLWRLSMGGKAWHLAVYAVLADYLENLMHAVILASYPNFPDWAAWVATVATPLKWTLLLVVVLRAAYLWWQGRARRG
ncbi:hypothetical protein [Oceanithermus sp.]